MAGEINEDKEFSKDIDRLLAGQEVETGEDLTEDYRAALQFAKKLQGLSDESSPFFKKQLRRHLLLKVAEQRTKAEKQKEKRASFWEALGNLVPRSPVWRTATATVIVAVLAIVVLWGTGTFTQTPEQWAQKGPAPAMTPPTMAPPANGGAEESPLVTLDSGAVLRLEPVLGETNVYLLGEETIVDLVFRNASSESIIVIPFPPTIQINQADTNTVVRSFAQGSESVEISASGTLDYTLVWNQLDENGEPVEPGRYLIIVSDVTIHKNTEPREAQASFGPVIELVIQSP